MSLEACHCVLARAICDKAQSRVQLINTYLNERLLDAQTLTQVPSLQTFMQAQPSPSPAYHDLAVHATYALGAGSFYARCCSAR